jgi:hypothetical protein
MINTCKLLFAATVLSLAACAVDDHANDDSIVTARVERDGILAPESLDLDVDDSADTDRRACWVTLLDCSLSTGWVMPNCSWTDGCSVETATTACGNLYERYC